MGLIVFALIYRDSRFMDRCIVSVVELLLRLPWVQSLACLCFASVCCEESNCVTCVQPEGACNATHGRSPGLGSSQRCLREFKHSNAFA